MPLYYFNLSFGERIVPDEEGVQLPNRAAAREEAFAVIRDLVDREDGRRWASWFLDVTDELGAFLRLPIGYPALEVLPKDGRAKSPAAAFKRPDPLPRLEATPEGLPRNQPAALVRQKLALRKRTAELIEQNFQLRKELTSQFSVSEQVRRRTRQVLASAQLVGWIGDSAAAAVDAAAVDNGQPHGNRPHLVLIPGGAGS